MPVTITAEQRDALYDQIIDHFSGIGDLWIVICRNDYDTAQRLGREFDDDLRLVLDDLGWGDGTGEPVELTMPPEDLRRVFNRLRDRAAGQRAAEARESAEAQPLRDRVELVTQACDQVLAALGDGPESDA